ncbi:hypothetical protein GNI_091120 [Gregarina niphandrodes]|uniref:Uncharacterized protein n=1 Tax=Gregarina niphandrodes TaxID=110365 RepID=A0A023B5D1_GRENI|nr:hypothetical protein GNI_091120 [Gregarina niphandrodes]EZG60079.1 hypothetical protein GNI_091120 [Gregarina niphandrodes]|eukprot:XP_011130863.1 hypothetical protein GNI_091120 [Gregarina niphandrodes]
MSRSVRAIRSGESSSAKSAFLGALLIDAPQVIMEVWDANLGALENVFVVGMMSETVSVTPRGSAWARTHPELEWNPYSENDARLHANDVLVADAVTEAAANASEEMRERARRFCASLAQEEDLVGDFGITNNLGHPLKRITAVRQSHGSLFLRLQFF